MATPTVTELLARLDEQQARIDRLEARNGGVTETETPRLTNRRGMVKTAAAGTAGVLGALLIEPAGALAAAKPPAEFDSSTTTAAVTAVNSGAGNALAATSKGHTAALAKNSGTGATAIGVSGQITAKTGAGTGVAGSSPGGTGVKGVSGTGVGVSGTSGSGGTGVLGTASSGTAVHGISADGYGYGVVGECANGYGIYGFASGSGYGIVGSAASGTAVYGSSGSGKGVIGTSSSTDGVAGTSSSGTGVSGSSSSGYGLYGASPHNYGIVGVSTSGNGVYGQVSTANQAGLVGRQEAAGGNWAMYGFGNIGATGTKSAVVETPDGKGHMKLYCMESPECWFEDFGSASLAAGRVSVEIDSDFAHTVHTADYYVFLQAEGVCNGLRVSKKTAKSFVVEEIGGGTSGAAFSYRIVALRKGVDAPRFDRIALPGAEHVELAATPEVARPAMPRSS